MSAELKQPVLIEVPAGLVVQFEQLVESYAETTEETPKSARRGVEISVLQMGIRGLSALLTEEKRVKAEFSGRMGWMKEEGDES